MTLLTLHRVPIQAPKRSWKEKGRLTANHPGDTVTDIEDHGEDGETPHMPEEVVGNVNASTGQSLGHQV